MHVIETPFISDTRGLGFVPMLETYLAQEGCYAEEDDWKAQQ